MPDLHQLNQSAVLSLRGGPRKGRKKPEIVSSTFSEFGVRVSLLMNQAEIQEEEMGCFIQHSYRGKDGK